MINLKPLFQDCLYKKYLGIECPGCGMQRAFECLVNGDVLGGIRLYPPLIPLLAMLVFLGLHLKFSFKHGHKVLLWMFIGNAAIITINYVFKIFYLI